MADRAQSGRYPGDARAGTAPAHDQLVADLKVLRERGMLRLRSLELPALAAAAHAAGYTDGAAPDPAAVDQLLRDAVDALGDDIVGQAAEYLFGLVRGTAGWRPKDLREHAAGFYGVSAETFRKEREGLLVAQTAEEILKLCLRHRRRQLSPLSTAPEVADAPHREPSEGSSLLLTAQSQTPASDARGSTPAEFRTYGPFRLPAGRSHATISVHGGMVDALTGVDVVAAPENTYFALPAPFKASLSARLRSIAARRDLAGEIVDDVVGRQIDEWMRTHGRAGLPVEPGTVAPTDAGELAAHGVRRIYHAAVAAPRPATNNYDIDPQAVFRATQNALALARAEREDFNPPLSSICIPLFGAGRGGLDPAVSFAWIWAAVTAQRDLLEGWHLHFLTRRMDGTLAVLKRLEGVRVGSGSLLDSN